jgi:hypothetical protein
LASHLVWFEAGALLPTAPTLEDAAGEPLDVDLQPGRGGVVPSMGAGYSFFAAPFSLHASTRLIAPLYSRIDSRPGTTSLSSLVGQYQPLSYLGFQTGLDARYAAFDRLADGDVDRGSGGFVALASVGVLVSPYEDLLVSGLLRLPVTDSLRGGASEGPDFLLAMTYDI